MLERKTMKKIMITVPDDLLQLTDKEAKNGKMSRSEIIRASLKRYLEERLKKELREKLKEGYIVGAKRDLKIAEEFSYSDYEVVKKYGGKY